MGDSQLTWSAVRFLTLAGFPPKVATKPARPLLVKLARIYFNFTPPLIIKNQCWALQFSPCSFSDITPITQLFFLFHSSWSTVSRASRIQAVLLSSIPFQSLPVDRSLLFSVPQNFGTFSRLFESSQPHYTVTFPTSTPAIANSNQLIHYSSP